MGSPPRSWEHSDDIMEVDNIYSDFFARENIRDNIAVILNNGDVPDAVAQGLRIASQIFVDNPSPHMFSFDPPPQRFGSDPPPQRFGSDPPPQRFGSDPQPQRFGSDPPPQRFGSDPPPQRFGSDPPPQRFGSDPPPQRFGSDPPPQMFGSDPPPQNEVNEPLNLVNRVHLIHPVDPVDAVQYDETSSDSFDSRSSSVIVGANTRTTPRPARFTESEDEGSSEESLIGFPIDPPAGSPAGFPTESPTDDLSSESSSETSPEVSPVASPVASPAASPATSPVASPATSPVASPATSPVASPATSPVASSATSPVASPATSPKRSAEKPTSEVIATTIQTKNDTPDEAFSCTICLDSLTNTGLHKPACLKCGHIFGENCLIRWIKVGCNSDARRCPTCNTKASIRDIRVLYTRNLIAVDTLELTALQRKLDQENRAKNLMRMEAERWKVRATVLDTEVRRLKTVAELTAMNTIPSTSGPTAPPTCIKKVTLCKNPGCRVMAFNKDDLVLVVSQYSDATIFNSHVIRKMNASLLEPSKEYIYAHKKPIRDMAFHPTENHYLASVGLDCHISLSDLRVNTVVSYIKVPEPLWSCCWAGDNTNVLVTGGQMGSLYYIDRRYVKLFESQQIRKLGCVSLNPLPPSTSRSFINGGFLKTRMDHLSVLEQDPVQEFYVYRETDLPLKGLWTSSSYDDESNLVLTSAKPSGPNKSIRHIVSKLADLNAEGPVLTPVTTFYGGDKSTQLSRSCLVPSNNRYNDDSLVCCYDEGSSTIKVFNVNKAKNVHNFKVTDKFLDLCPLPGIIINGRRTIAGLSENAVSMFSV